MNYKVLSSKTGGRLANQLYFALQAFKMSKDGVKWKYQTALDSYCRYYDINEASDVFNISEYVTQNEYVDSYLTYNRYYQTINQDFSYDDVKRFIQETFSCSARVKEKMNITNPNEVAIHIRNGDYLNIPSTFCFDKTKYIENSIGCLDEKIDCCTIYSDQIEHAHFLDDILTKRFKTVRYVSKDCIDDFISIATTKNKILWNSTYSIWSGFIGDVLFDGNQNITLPSMFSRECEMKTLIPNHWRTI